MVTSFKPVTKTGRKVMKTIKLELTDNQYKILSKGNESIQSNIKKIINKSPQMKCYESLDSLFGFLMNKLMRTEDRSDTVSLKDMYADYYSYYLDNLKNPRELIEGRSWSNHFATKQQMRGFLEDMDIVYTKGRANASVFRFVKLVEEITEDEEWEL